MKNKYNLKVGDKVTTWGNKTVYTIAEVDGELVLEGYKPLSQVNCTPIKVEHPR